MGAPACQSSETERWVTTNNSTVDLDLDQVSEAYKNAEGPADFERKVNEIYTGDEVISIAVVDKDDKSQVVTGFFDKDEDGKIAEAEKVFEINRTITGEKGNYQVTGHGAYGGYHSPMMDIAMGMMLGSMLMGPMRPGYVVAAPYTTPPGQRAALRANRDGYRAATPSRFSKSSQSGRSYGSGKSFGGSKGRSGGGRFGAQSATRRSVARRLEA